MSLALFYNRAAGEGAIYIIDGTTSPRLLKKYTNWRISWSLIISGHFGGNGPTDYLFYDRATGVAEFYAVDNNGEISLIQSYDNWSTDITHIIPGNFGGASHTGQTDLLIYGRDQGSASFYTVWNGNITLLKSYDNWSTDITHIIPGNFGGTSQTGQTDLLIYSRDQGSASFYTVWNGNITLLKSHDNWSTDITHIIPGNFAGGITSQTDLLLFARDRGSASFYTVWNGNISQLQSYNNWSTNITHLIPGNFLGLISPYDTDSPTTDLFIYSSNSRQGVLYTTWRGNITHAQTIENLVIESTLIEPAARAVAIVLSGGGAKGDFQVGALKFLYERGIRPKVISGTSVGSINAVKLAEGEIGPDSGLKGLEQIWLGLQYNWDMYNEEEWLRRITNSKVKQFFEQSFGEAAGLMGGLLAKFVLFPPLLLIDAIQSGVDITQLLNAVKEAEASKSAYNLEPIWERLNKPEFLNIDRVRQSGIRLRIALVGLESGALQHVNQLGEFLESQQAPVDIRSAVLASASIPGIFRPVKLNDENYVDGGVRDILPIQTAIAAGATEIVGIVASSPIRPSEHSFDDRNLVNILERSVGGIMTDEITRNETAPARGWGIKLTVIQPTLGDKELHDALTIVPGLIRISIGYGYMRAADVIEVPLEHRPRCMQLADEITQLRKEIFRLELWARTANLLLIEPQARNDLMQVRVMKRQLKAMVDERRNIGGIGSVPTDVHSWWLEWEYRLDPPFIATPWDAVEDRGAILVDPETPP